MLFSEKPAILVVDDESIVRTILEQILHSQGYRVCCAIYGQEAMELFHKAPEGVALLLTDLTMPRKNGIELIREVRQVKPRLPVVVMSGYHNALKEELHGIAFLAKPFNPQKLLEAVEQNLKPA